MDVQHPRRWQNSHVAFLMDSALLKEKSGVGEGEGEAGAVGKTRSVFDCVGLHRRQDTYCTCEGISPLLFCEWISGWMRRLPRSPGANSNAAAAQMTPVLLTNRILKKEQVGNFLFLLFVECLSPTIAWSLSYLSGGVNVHAGEEVDASRSHVSPGLGSPLGFPSNLHCRRRAPLNYWTLGLNADDFGTS